ncbi:MAG: hypothetical protein AB7Q01_07155 [Gammaproteobacteria bacterium]
MQQQTRVIVNLGGLFGRVSGYAVIGQGRNLWIEGEEVRLRVPKGERIGITLDGQSVIYGEFEFDEGAPNPALVTERGHRIPMSCARKMTCAAVR